MKNSKVIILCSVILLLAGALAVQAQETEQTILVTEGMRLEISNHAGEVIVRSWDKNEVRILAEHGSRDEVEIEEGENTLRVQARNSRGRAAIVDYQIQAPRWMDIEVAGPYCDIEIQDIEGQLYLETVEGEIRVKGGGGHVSMRSIEGDLWLEGADGRIEMDSVDGDIFLRGITGPVRAETVDGELVLLDIRSADVEVSTVDGDIVFEGSVDPEGEYHMITHEGDIRVGVPAESNLTLIVAIADGDFDSCFPVETTKRRSGHRFRMTLGEGSARMELETFEGDVTVCRPGT